MAKVGLAKVGFDPFLDHVHLGCTQRGDTPNESSLSNLEQCSNHEFLLEHLKNCMSEKPHAIIVAWSYDMEGDARKCVERCCELANEKIEQLDKVSTTCLTTIISRKRNLNHLENCQKYVLTKCLKMLVTGTNTNNLAQAVTKWTRASNRRFARLIFYIHHTNDH